MQPNSVRITPQASVRKAVALHKNGQHDAALEILRATLKKYPNHFESLGLLVEICLSCNLLREAEDAAWQAVEIDSRAAQKAQLYYAVLDKYMRQRSFLKMQRAAARLTVTKPGDGLAWNYLGISLIEQQKPVPACEALTHAVEILPDNPHVLTNLGNVLLTLERFGAAVDVLKKAVVLAPDLAAAFNNLGNALRYVGDHDGAIRNLSRSLELQPGQAYVLNNLGLAYRSVCEYHAAIRCYQDALEVQPDLHQVYPNLVDAMRQAGQVRESIELCEKILPLVPPTPELWGNFANALRDANHINAALEAYIKALSFRTDTESSFNSRTFGQFLFCLNYHPDMSPEVIFGAYRDYDKRFCEPLKATWMPHANEKRTDRRLKIAYVSSVFYSQVCRFFLLPLLERHDRSQVEVFAYSNAPVKDKVTQAYINAVDHWMPVLAMTDEQLAERIRADGIDILIDVSGHTADNRLGVFARKPAPVAVHWLEYGYTTGVSAIDYYLTDTPTATEECDGHLFAEKIWCLDGPAYPYRPDVWPEPNPSPFLKDGIVTFGSLSRSVRINYKVVRVWAAILNAMPNSRLAINSGDFRDHKVAEEMTERFMRYGIDRSRLLIGYDTPSYKALEKIDITLDCFPHNSGTTLMESLYMGIPFISLVDRPSIGRIGASILTAAGHPEWIVNTEEEYAQKAVMLAHDHEALIRHRQNLRADMQASPLMDEIGFARSVERAYRKMWQIWCEENPV